MKNVLFILGLVLVSRAQAAEVKVGCDIQYNSQRNQYTTQQVYAIEEFGFKTLTFGTYSFQIGVGEKQVVASGAVHNLIYTYLWSPKYNGYVAAATSVNPMAPASFDFEDPQTLERLAVSCKEIK